MIVIDASSLTKFILKEEHWEDVEPYLETGLNSLDYVFLESASAIWRESVLRNRLSLEDAAKKLKSLESIQANVISSEAAVGYLKDGFEIATHEKIHIYDSLYIAQAKIKGTLLTSDKNQRNIALKLGIKAIFII